MEQTINIQELVQDQHNFNKGTAEGEKLMQKSLTELGAGRSILIDKDGNIIAGNKTQKAAIAAGIQKVRVIESDGSELIAVKRTDLSIDSKKGRELALADNVTTQVNLAWDDVELAKVELEIGIDPTEWGLEIGNELNADDFGEDFDLAKGDHGEFRRWGFMLYDEQYELIAEAIKSLKSDANFKAYCEASRNDNENGNAITYIVQKWAEQRR